MHCEIRCKDCFYFNKQRFKRKKKYKSFTLFWCCINYKGNSYLIDSFTLWIPNFVCQYNLNPPPPPLQSAHVTHYEQKYLLHVRILIPPFFNGTPPLCIIDIKYCVGGWVPLWCPINKWPKIPQTTGAFSPHHFPRFLYTVLAQCAYMSCYFIDFEFPLHWN